jgi:hypothetical protein
MPRRGSWLREEFQIRIIERAQGRPTPETQSLQPEMTIVKPLRIEPWGMREFGIRTIDGHRMMFGSSS